MSSSRRGRAHPDGLSPWPLHAAAYLSAVQNEVVGRSP